MKVTVIPIGPLGMVPKGLQGRLKELEIKGAIKTIQTKALVRLARRALRKLPVTKMSVKDHQVKGVWKTHQQWNNNMLSSNMYNLMKEKKKKKKKAKPFFSSTMQ